MVKDLERARINVGICEDILLGGTVYDQKGASPELEQAYAHTLKSIEKLKESFTGRLELQIMFMPINRREIDALAKLIKRIGPDGVQLNTPKRPYPMESHIESRGTHDRNGLSWPTRNLAVISSEEANDIEDFLREKTNVPLVSVYH